MNAAHYARAGDALQAALHEALGDDYTPAVAEAWQAAYRMIAETMLAGGSPTAA